MPTRAFDLSIVVPSRLQVQPERNGSLWLSRALGTIARQTAFKKLSIEILVGLDTGVAPPALPPSPALDCVRFVNAPAGRKPSQAAAINTAATAARGTTLAVLEDDDAWKQTFLQTALAALADCDFVSSSQMLVDRHGLPLEVMYFPTPSGWVMPRALWQEIGGFNERMVYHVDVEWIGRLNKSGKRRAHLVESGFPLDDAFLKQHRRWLAHLAKGQPHPVKLVQHRWPTPLVVRTQNEAGGTGQIRRSPDAAERSKREMAALRKRFGEIPW
ncbi:MAG: hypothetical protein WD711_10365 [Dongiaceae bacterium]